MDWLQNGAPIKKVYHQFFFFGGGGEFTFAISVDINIKIGLSLI